VTTASEREWLRVNAYLREHRHDLAVRASGRYPAGVRLAGTPLLAPPSWRPVAPVPLGNIDLEWRSDAPPPAVTDVAAIAPDLLPERADGTRYASHSAVIAGLAAPAVFENRATYRLIAADLADGRPRLTFTVGRFFDSVDVDGAAAHEYAAAELGPRTERKLRDAVGDPCDLSARPATLAVSTLTLRHDRGRGRASFPLHWRDPARVAHAGGMYQVIPVGVFQPSGEAPWNERNDFGLWRGMLREFAEELLGEAEGYGSEAAQIDYAGWPFAARMSEGLATGQVRAWCLGLGADPLTFALDLLTVVVIDAPLYDDLFGDAVRDNAEGTVLPPRPFDQPTVGELIGRHAVQAAGAALLRLAVSRRDVLLDALPAPLAPCGQVRALGAERGVLAVPRVHPGDVREPAEDLLGHVVDQGREASRIPLRVTHAAREQAVAGEQVRLRARRVAKRDAARRVPAQVDDGQRRLAELDRVAVLDQFVGRHRDSGGVQRVCHGGRAGRLAHPCQRLPVVGMLMRGHDSLHRGVADHLQQSLRLGGRVDEQPLPGPAVAQQVGVVVHRPHGDLGHRHAVDVPRVSRPADTYVSCVGHIRNLSWNVPLCSRRDTARRPSQAPVAGWTAPIPIMPRGSDIRAASRQLASNYRGRQAAEGGALTPAARPPGLPRESPRGMGQRS
jgi:hypothetical protein